MLEKDLEKKFECIVEKQSIRFSKNKSTDAVWVHLKHIVSNNSTWEQLETEVRLDREESDCISGLN